MYLDKIYTNQPVTVTLTVGMVTIHTQDIVRIVLGGLYVYDHFDFLYRPDGENHEKTISVDCIISKTDCITKCELYHQDRLYHHCITVPDPDPRNFLKCVTKYSMYW